jgi:hypothetical protein
MNAHGKHIFEDLHRRLDMEYVRFGGPWSEAVRFYAAADGNSEVLMPRHLPVCAGNLVEQDAADWKGGVSEEGLN